MGKAVTNTKPKRPKSGMAAGSQGLAGAITPPQGGQSTAVNRPNKVGLPTPGQLSPSGRPLTNAEIKKQQLKKMIDDMGEEGDGRTPPVVRLGDASMAAPFTAKHSSVRPTVDVIRQGRSTLVTTLQMFKILGLNCLATAYVFSVMYLDGVKLGDMQVTFSFLSYSFSAVGLGFFPKLWECKADHRSSMLGILHRSCILCAC